ncbi:MAG: hypothetical protein N3F64_07075 [Nitrososphaeria archaeon]|nr:hypothetical protein [Nitrososphaeria archaeon]
MSDDVYKLREKWEKRKASFYSRMERDIATGYFDKEMESLIRTIFKIEGAYPTSSCSGRILIIASRVPWKKRNVKIVYKIHEINKSSKQQILRKILELEDEDLWLYLQPPIIHVSCLNIKIATELIKLARNTGFKESKIFMKTKTGWHLELKGKELLVVPIKLENILLFELEKLELIIEEALRILNDFKEKIIKFSRGIEYILVK